MAKTAQSTHSSALYSTTT